MVDRMNNTPLSNAQQIRIWSGVGVGVLLLISIIGMPGSLAVVTNYDGNGGSAIVDTSPSGFYGWLALALICLLAEAILAAFTIYRLYRPAAPQSAPGGQASYNGGQQSYAYPPQPTPGWEPGQPPQPAQSWGPGQPPQATPGWGPGRPPQSAPGPHESPPVPPQSAPGPSQSRQPRQPQGLPAPHCYAR